MRKKLDNKNPTRPIMPFFYLLLSMIFVEHHSYNVDKPISKKLFLHECFKNLNDVFTTLMVFICCFLPMTLSNDFKAKHSCLQNNNGPSF
jgi:hypothetical protein